MSQYDEILSHVPVQQLAGQFGVGEDEVRRAAEQALPALLGGLQANAEDPAGAASLARALGEHDGDVPRDLDQVDTADGAKIVGNIFGDNTDQVMGRLSGASTASGAGGVGGDLVKKLLPILAPIVLSWLAGKLRGQGGLGGVLGDLMGGGAPSAPSPRPTQIDDGPLFPGGQGAQSGPTQVPTGPGTAGPGSTGPGSTPPAQTSGSNPITDILGGVLGGSGGGGVLGGILGDLLGAGRRR